MKLLTRTYQKIFLWLIPILLVSSVFSFFMIKYIVYEETDEYLTYEMNRLTSYHKSENDLPDFHKVTEIIENQKLDKPFFKDTLILELGDNERVPHRELHFSINHKGKDFTLVLRQLLPGNDDVFQGSLLMMLGIFIIISLFLLIMAKVLSASLWSPFYKTLNTLSAFKITETVPTFPASKIDEFNSLNSTIEELLNKMAVDYKRTKQFNENASHELQTHLSIIRLNAEKLINTEQNDAESLAHLQTIINASAKLSSAQKSLLLLSKIGNLEFNNNTNLNFSEIISSSLPFFEEIIAIRQLTLKLDLDDCQLFIDQGLAEILINNLLKNAVKHNIENGFISVHLSAESLLIENSGTEFKGDPSTLFERHIIGTSGNLGLGLAIVKQICDIYNYRISYDVKENRHKIQIIFAK